jgi:hypothetical protein
MTIRPGRGPLPVRKQKNDDRSPPCDDRYDERYDERYPGEHPAYSLTDRILTNWGRTGRALTLIVVIVGMLVAGMWLLNLEVTVGPVHIGG